MGELEVDLVGAADSWKWMELMSSWKIVGGSSNEDNQQAQWNFGKGQGGIEVGQQVEGCSGGQRLQGMLGNEVDDVVIVGSR